MNRKVLDKILSWPVDRAGMRAAPMAQNRDVRAARIARSPEGKRPSSAPSVVLDTVRRTLLEEAVGIAHLLTKRLCSEHVAVICRIVRDSGGDIGTT